MKTRLLGMIVNQDGNSGKFQKNQRESK